MDQKKTNFAWVKNALKMQANLKTMRASLTFKIYISFVFFRNWNASIKDWWDFLNKEFLASE